MSALLNTTDPKVLEASQQEREAVTKAIGLPQEYAKLGAIRQGSASRSNSEDRQGSGGGVSRAGLSESSDEEDVPPLSRASSTKSNRETDGDDGTSTDEVAGFEDMPNFIPGLGDQSDMESCV